MTRTSPTQNIPFCILRLTAAKSASAGHIGGSACVKHAERS